jgi:MYXO-CTERM domain-containing protein
MLSRFNAIMAALVLAMGVGSAQAEIYKVYTSDLAVKPGTGTTAASTFGINLNVSGILAVPGPANQPPAVTTGFISSSLSGSGEIDMNLDATNSGTLNITGLKLALADVSFLQSGTVFGFSPYTVDLKLKNVQIEINATGINVVNGAFSITNATVGSLALNGGQLDYILSVAALGVNETGTLSLEGDDAVVVNFADLGTAVISGRADDDSSGNDSGTPDGTSHTDNIPGTTGVSLIDNDGTEVNVNFQGLTIASSLDLDGTALPITIGVTGGISVSVPEAGSMTLVGLAGVAGLAAVRMRRRNG